MEDLECFCGSVRLVSDVIIMPRVESDPNPGLTCPFQAKLSVSDHTGQKPY